jgi:hypothetical protein
VVVFFMDVKKYNGDLGSDFVSECRIYIAVAEACWRPIDPSHSMHVFEWLCWRQRRKYPLVRRQDRIISDGMIT